MASSRLYRATKHDLDAIDRCNRATLPENYPRAFYEQFMASNAASNYVIDDGDGDIAGYILAMTQKDDSGTDCVYFCSIAVYPQYRRRGYASALMRAVEHDLKRRFPSLCYLHLHVRRSNIIAQNFYRTSGYRAHSTVRNYYHGEDALVMRKDYT